MKCRPSRPPASKTRSQSQQGHTVPGSGVPKTKMGAYFPSMCWLGLLLGSIDCGSESIALFPIDTAYPIRYNAPICPRSSKDRATLS